MDDKIKAFPSGNGVNPYCYGMDLRDYLASSAMSALVIHYSRIEAIVSKCHDEIASESYSLADAMLKARDV